MSKKDYYEKSKDIISNKAKEHYINNKELIREHANNKYKSLTKDKKQKVKDYQKEYQKKYHEAKKLNNKITASA